jgi:hypothetical protein
MSLQAHLDNVPAMTDILIKTRVQADAKPASH